MNRRYMLLFVYAMLFMITNTAFALESVSLQLRWKHQFQFAGYYAALNQGYYREAGLDVVIQEGGPNINPVTDVITGKADFGIGVSSLLIDYYKNRPVRMLAPVFQHSPNILLVYGKNKRLEDLVNDKAGKTVFMHGDQDLELKAMFLNEGISLDKLNVGHDQNHLTDLIEQKIEALNAYLSNEPFTLEQQQIPYTILKPENYGMDFYGDVLFTSQYLAANKPDIAMAFYQASMKGWRYAFDHQDEIIDLILSHYNTQHKTRAHLEYEAGVLRSLVNPDIIDIGHNNPGRWQHIANTYQRFGLIQQDKPLDNFFFYQKEKDLTWLYWTLIISIIIVFVISRIAISIYRINQQLSIALEDKSRNEERYRILFHNSASAGVVWRDNFIITDWNQQAEKLFGWTKDEVLGKCFIRFLVAEEERDQVSYRLSTMPKEQTSLHMINQNLTRDHQRITCDWFNSWLPERPGEPQEIVSLANDITERQKMENQIRQLAFFDPLTQLANRRLLLDRLAQATASIDAEYRYRALIYIDLDNFKPLNDKHGHDVGDQLLKQVADRLRQQSTASDLAARMGGDEFVVLICDLGLDAALAQQVAVARAEAIRHSLAQNYELREADGKIITHHCFASIGVTLFNRAEDDNAIFRAADSAMYRAKAAGRNQVCVHHHVTLS